MADLTARPTTAQSECGRTGQAGCRGRPPGDSVVQVREPVGGPGAPTAYGVYDRLLLGPEPGKEQSNDPAAVAQRAVTTAHAMERNLVLWFNFHLGCAFHSPPKKKKRPSSGRRTSRVRRAGSKLSSRSGHGSLADRRMSTGRRKSTARRKSVLMRKPSMKGGKRRKSTYVRRGRHSQMGTGGYHRTTLGSAQYSAKRDTLATPGVESSINSRMRRRASTVSTVSEDAGTTPTSLTLSALTTALAPATHLAAGSKHGSVISMVLCEAVGILVVPTHACVTLAGA